jgi:hypothetical protein
MLPYGRVLDNTVHYSGDTHMFAMFRNLFAAFASLFSAAEKLANAANHGASFVEGEAAHFNDKTALVRAQEYKRLKSTFDQEDMKMMAEMRQAAKELDKQDAATAKKAA